MAPQRDQFLGEAVIILSLFHMDCEQDDVTRCLCARRNHNEVVGLLKLSLGM